MEDEGKKFLVKHPDCGYCQLAEQALDEDIKSGKVGVIDASTPEGAEIAKKLGVDNVPACAEKTADGYKLCKLEELYK